MVNEREPPKPRPYHTGTKENATTRRVEPEFGKPSPLGLSRESPFNIPKANKPRPEHHRPALTVCQSTNDNRVVDPFQIVKPSSAFSGYQSAVGDDDIVEIARPANVSWTTRPTPKPYFSSNPTKSAISKSSSNLKSFIDLTTNDVGVSTNTSLYLAESRAIEAFSYLDSAKANENIKALLEGAFEDEDDKPRTRQHRKKLQSQMDDLAEKLKGIEVNEQKEDQKNVNGSDKTEEEEEDEEEEDDGSVEGLKVKLLPHQIEGVSWMRDKETGQKKTRGVLPKGGILADDMGLGKTVQTIALMLTNPRPPPETATESGNKTDKTRIPIQVGKGTLIVAPVALIKQWESEIDTKIESSHRLKVGIYHGSGRTKLAKSLTKYDVVITTYGTLSSEHASSTKGDDKPERKSGCFGVHWYRVVLDEAHTIKNRNAKSTQAVYALDSLYRWCLTGTPMQNNLDELQSLIRFLRIKPYDELAAWREQITRPLNNGRGGLAIRRLQVYLKAFMKRRTKDVLKLAGGLDSKTPHGNQSSNSFQITKRDVIKVEAEFTEEERGFYSRLEDRTDRSLENMIGHQKLNYASALVLLLRLRQACNHVDLVKGDLAQEKDSFVNTNGTQPKSSQAGDVDEIANMLGGLSVISKRCDICLIDLTTEEANNGAIRCADCEADLKIHVGLSKEKKRDKHKKKSKSKSKEKRTGVQAGDAKKPRGYRGRPIALDSDDEDEGEWIVPEDKRAMADLGVAGGTDDENAEGGGEWIGSEDSETGDDEDEDDSTGDEEDVDENDEELNSVDCVALSNLSSSTKIRYLMRILKREAREFKFIVFSVFTSMMDKIEPFLKGAGIGYARYDGGMRNDLREASLDKLRNSSRTRVLLCSLRAGSLGLNLTAASRVVILEPFWNPVSILQPSHIFAVPPILTLPAQFVEEQAIDRVHRLNQTIDVKVYKITIKDTVEGRILDLQERKRELASATIEGKTAAGKLTMNDMLALFRHDAEAKFAPDEGLGFSSGNGRLLKPKEVSEDSYGYASTTTSSLNGSQGRRTTPPVMERDRNNKNRKPTQESSIYGRRW
ncbi:hypothetical protein PRK78_003606 [Emydomyces testavorans]|uniref:Uncharacterized protein n=1 Tax=Emydomyces testavorans TaxID=2070801 RepID=A0AAF0IKR6_9EURO|nr:hypothetical protein PRK78_003606 [Emydomyces testavorans]